MKLPPIQDLQVVALPKLTEVVQMHGIPVYLLHGGSQEILRCEWIYRAGRPEENKPGQSQAANRLRLSGTKSLTSKEIYEFIDSKGGTISAPGQITHSQLTLHCLQRQFSRFRGLMQEVLAGTTFPESEIETYKTIQIGKLKEDLAKSDVVAFRAITELIYGKDHPFGYNSTEESIQAIRQGDLLDFQKRQFHAENAFVVLCGKYSNQDLKELDQILSAIPSRSQFDISQKKSTAIPGRPESIQILMEEKVQASIRIGKLVCAVDHPDFHDLVILNGLLGGYFGSRLMIQLREDQGLTYNIYSSVEILRDTSYLYIATEVSPENVHVAIESIHAELLRLQNEPVSMEELHMFRNAMLGTWLTTIDGPFQTMDVYKTFICDGRNPDQANVFNERLVTITPEDLMKIAIQYFSPETFHQVIVS